MKRHEYWCPGCKSHVLLRSRSQKCPLCLERKMVRQSLKKDPEAAEINQPPVATGE